MKETKAHVTMKEKKMEKDSSAIIEEYKKNLEELTFNAKPIIDSLSVFAKVNNKEAARISVLILNKIKEKQEKLPFFYLIDSICNNCGEPYKTFFSLSIAEYFKQAFFSVNKKTKDSLFRLLKIWEENKIFPMDVILNIKKHIKPVYTLSQCPVKENNHSLNKQQKDSSKWLYLYSKEALLCPNCGIRFDKDKKSLFENHIDKHFKQNKQTKTDKFQKREWFCPISKWQQNKNNKKKENVSSDVVVTESFSVTFCFLCHEKIEKKYNQENDNWILINTLKTDEGICHASCLEDF